MGVSALKQLLPLHGADVVIALFLLEESGRGVSIAELWDKISGRYELSVSLRNRLPQILAFALIRTQLYGGTEYHGNLLSRPLSMSLQPFAEQ